MAELMMPQIGGKRKTRAPKIDLTPMVDLGFLLITFFMYTTTLSRPNALMLNMPYKPSDQQDCPIPASRSITLTPINNHRTVYYEGVLENKNQLKVCVNKDIRKVLTDKKKTLAALPASMPAKLRNMFVLIKPNADCSYGDVVGLLDEMNITDIRTYAIVDLSALEKEWISGL